MTVDAKTIKRIEALEKFREAAEVKLLEFDLQAANIRFYLEHGTAAGLKKLPTGPDNRTLAELLADHFSGISFDRITPAKPEKGTPDHA